MAEQQQSAPNQYTQIYTLGVEPGIKRDGTTFEAREYSDGTWCRFQRGIPKKIGGYSELFTTFSGISRGLVMNGYNGVNYVFSGTQNGLDIFTTGQTFGTGSGAYTGQFEVGYSQFALATANTTQFTISSSTDLTGVFSAGSTIVFNQNTSPTTYTVSTSSFNNVSNVTTVTYSPPAGSAPSNVWIANYKFEANPNLLWQFDFQYSPAGGTLNLLMHPGLNLNNIDNSIDTQVYIGSTLPGSGNQWTFTGLADTAGTAPTYRPIVVDGGVCALHPFIFVYGTNGFIANNNVSSVYSQQSLSDWNGPLSNQVNVAAGKIVKGMPLRGGTASPSGLFWATDSLIKVSFVNNPPTYWNYDIVSSHISIMSSSSVVEMDGLYYWMGVDRFYVYNGYVTVLPNDKNVNWLFNNLNYTQRQKVWATKVPRYNEIWFFYPRGNATECTDAIIYNVKDKLWYDAGEAIGSQRSAGYTTEVFPTPIWADWNYNVTYNDPVTVISTPTGQTAPTTYQFYVQGNYTPTFTPSSYLSLSSDPTAKKYQVSTSRFIFNTTIEGIGGATLVTTTTPFDTTPAVGQSIFPMLGGYSIWQHEIGLNKASIVGEEAIYSSFTTCDISWVGGTPTGDASPAINRRLHLRRIEPDFVQAGNLTLSILGRKFATSTTETNGPFTFTPNTEKIDLRVEHREMRLLFESNELDGNYEMGRLLVTAEFGDERP